jgi:predicted RNA-binding Zn ribbon-like protein
VKLSQKYAVPAHLALLYDFLNSRDERRYVEHGVAHSPGDELAAPDDLRRWMRQRGLLRDEEQVGFKLHRQALELREALRDLVSIPPQERTATRAAVAAANRLSNASEAFSLVVAAARDGVSLEPAQGSSGLARVLAELFGLAARSELERLRMCASEDCNWIFFDRTKPANRRWCSSLVCGNRQKTRDYRLRHGASS